ncbi:hypothetical protein ACJX0J_032637 [Zea mays]
MSDSQILFIVQSHGYISIDYHTTTHLECLSLLIDVLCLRPIINICISVAENMEMASPVQSLLLHSPSFGQEMNRAQEQNITVGTQAVAEELAQYYPIHWDIGDAGAGDNGFKLIGIAAPAHVNIAAVIHGDGAYVARNKEIADREKYKKIQRKQRQDNGQKGGGEKQRQKNGGHIKEENNGTHCQDDLGIVSVWLKRRQHDGDRLCYLMLLHIERHVGISVVDCRETANWQG